MKERLELDDSFEEKEKDSEKPKEKNSILNEPEKDINILEIKTTQTIKWQEDDIKNYNDRVKEMTKNILSRLIKISIVLMIKIKYKNQKKIKIQTIIIMLIINI